ncbi:MAG: hypothetical protein ACREUA_03085 [Burkholderiales bacterium]
MAVEEQLEAVRGYLGAEFPEHTLRDYPDGADHSFVVEKAQQRYLATVSKEVFDQTPASRVAEILSAARLAVILRKVGDFRIIVTNSGCIFDSMPRGIFCKPDSGTSCAASWER